MLVVINHSVTTVWTEMNDSLVFSKIDGARGVLAGNESLIRPKKEYDMLDELVQNGITWKPRLRPCHFADWSRHGRE